MKLRIPNSIKTGPLWISLDLEWWSVQFRRREKCGMFRNRPGIIGGRWGFYFLGVEFGSRNPGNRFGLLLAKLGLWRW